MVFRPKAVNDQLSTDRSVSYFNNPSNVTKRTTSYNAPAIRTGAKGVSQSMSQFKARNQRKMLKFPIQQPKYFTLLEYAKYSRLGVQGTTGVTSPLLNVAFQTEGTIALPMPISGLVDRQDIEYGRFNLGGWGSAVKAGIISGLVGSLNNQFTDGAKNSLLGGKGNFSGSDLALSGASGAIAGGQKYLSETSPSKMFYDALGTSAELAGSTLLAQAGDAAKAIAGIAPNEFVTLLFKGPTYKKHRLSWKLLPSSFDESIIIRDIVIKLNNLAAPGLSSNGFLFDFPYLVYPSYRPNADWMYKFKPCVITAVETDFAPTRIPAFYTSRKQNSNEANPPEAVTITIELTEIEFWLRNQFDDSKGYTPDNIAKTHRDPTKAATTTVNTTESENNNTKYETGGGF
jgi:hypothetical protein